MSLLLFPLQTRRTDATRGAIARQVPRAIAMGIPDARVVSWTVRRGPHVAHVLVETALPLEVVRGEMAAHGASHGVIGTLDLEAPDVNITLQLVTPTDAEPLPVVTATTLREAVQAAGTAVAAAAGSAWDGTHVPPEAVDAWLADLDNSVLVEAGGTGAVHPARAAFASLIEVVQAAPDFTPALDELRTRRATWAEAASDVALELAAELAAATGEDGDYEAWAELAEANDDSATQERALAAWSRTTARPARARVQLGKLLIRLRRSREAMPLLEEATEDAEWRDAAVTYLGVAFASVGEIGRAVELWRRVADEGSDQGFVRLAREHLQRATSLQGMS